MGSTRSAASRWGLKFLQLVSSKYERAAAAIDLFADRAEANRSQMRPAAGFAAETSAVFPANAIKEP
jgi:hypothetical protein